MTYPRRAGKDEKMKWQHKIIFGLRDVEILNQHGAEGWELAAVTVGMAYFKRPLADEPDAKPAEIVHGVNCPKLAHTSDTFQYLDNHRHTDDGPFIVDGVPYCGRCHRQIENYGKVEPVQSEANQLWEELECAKKELATLNRHHSAELLNAEKYREIVGILCEAVKPIVDHWESGRSLTTIGDGYLHALGRAHRTAKAAIHSEVENGKQTRKNRPGDYR